MNKCGNCEAMRILKVEEAKDETEKTMIDKKILKIIQVGNGSEEKTDIGIEDKMDLDLVDDEDQENLKTKTVQQKPLG